MSEDGAFVEIDNSKLSRDGLVLLGMKEFGDKWVNQLMMLAGRQSHQGVAKVMVEIAEEMARERDEIAVALTKSALKNKSGVLHSIRKD